MDNEPVTTEAGRALRLLRATVLAGVVTVLGTVAHSLAGGRLPGATGFAVLLVLLVAGAAPLLARAASTRRLVALVVGGQTFVHAALTATSGHAGDGVGVSSPAPVVPTIPDSVLTSSHREGTLAELLHPQPAAGSGTGPTVPDWVLHLLADLQPAQLPMALAHLLAAVGVGWWLASGERALFALLALAAAPLLRLLAPAALPVAIGPVRAVRTAFRLRVVRREVLLSSSLARRGPPAPVLLAT